MHAVEFAQDTAGAVDNDESGAGELYAPADALQQGGAGFFFEGGNLLGDGGGGEAECFGCGDDGAAFLDFEEHLHTSDVVDGHIFLPGALGIALAVVATVFHGASLIVDSCIWYRAGFRPALFETPEVGCRHVGLCSEYFRAECDDSWG